MIEIRPARPDEADILAAIGLAAWRKGISPHVSVSVARRMETDNRYAPFVRDMGPRLLVATVQGTPAGIGGCEDDDENISDIWVSPDFEGRGVGSALVRAIMHEIAHRGHQLARIEVAALNARALGLYQHLGFKPAWRKTVFDPILDNELEKVGLEIAFPIPSPSRI